MDKHAEEVLSLAKTVHVGTNVREIASSPDCRVLKLEDRTGEGFMTMYRLWEGIYIMYNDMHLKSCISQFQAEDSLFCIDYCKEGRIEHESAGGVRYYMGKGDMRVDMRLHHEGIVHLPLCHYHGITVGFQIAPAQTSLRGFLPSANLNALAQKFCPKGKELVLHTKPQIETVFMQLYQPPEQDKMIYFRLKVMELLLLLNAISLEEYTENRPYFPSAQTEKVKMIHDFMISHLDTDFTIEELAEKFEIPTATMRKCFKGIYGCSMYQYLKQYRIQMAAEILKTERQRKISDIALSIGYDNASKFSAAFRDIIGMTPQAYRNTNYQEEF